MLQPQYQPRLQVPLLHPITRQSQQAARVLEVLRDFDGDNQLTFRQELNVSAFLVETNIVAERGSLEQNITHAVCQPDLVQFHTSPHWMDYRFTTKADSANPL